MTADPTGSLAIVLHAHLPFVRHPEHSEFLEENWLFEAMIESYVPILEMLTHFAEHEIPARLTMSLSPTLCEMLRDDLLRERFLRHLEKLIELSAKEMERHRHDPPYLTLATHYHQRFTRVRDLFVDVWHRDLVAQFAALQNHGVLEIMACAGTHAFLPYIRETRALRAQLRIGLQTYRHHFGKDAKGIWLPECGYAPGLDAILKGEGVRYFMIDSHGALFGTPRPTRGTFAPLRCPGGVVAFPRDIESGKQVWSADMGYPGDPVYREFYRDLGHDGDEEYVAPYLNSAGHRHDLGIKYHRVTGDVSLAEKDLYNPGIAAQKADEHAANYLFNREHQCRHMESVIHQRPLVVAPYDAELFGHWWYEGPRWLGSVLQGGAAMEQIELLTPGEYLARHPDLETVEPCACSWGDRGYYETWLNGNNDWIYPHLHEAERRMIAMAQANSEPNEMTERALNQAARELMLAESSDWAFILTTGTMPTYAASRITSHIERFTRLYEMIGEHAIDPAVLDEYEHRDNLFADLDYRIYR